MKSKRFLKKCTPSYFFFNLSEIFSKVFKNTLKFLFKNTLKIKVYHGQVVAMCQILIKQ